MAPGVPCAAAMSTSSLGCVILSEGRRTRKLPRAPWKRPQPDGPLFSSCRLLAHGPPSSPHFGERHGVPEGHGGRSRGGGIITLILSQQQGHVSPHRLNGCFQRVEGICYVGINYADWDAREQCPFVMRLRPSQGECGASQATSHVPASIAWDRPGPGALPPVSLDLHNFGRTPFTTFLPRGGPNTD